MDREDAAAQIAAARALLQAVARETDSPQIAQCLREADLNLHWALWNLGATSTLAPELEAPL